MEALRTQLGVGRQAETVDGFQNALVFELLESLELGLEVQLIVELFHMPHVLLVRPAVAFLKNTKLCNYLTGPRGFEWSRLTLRISSCSGLAFLSA